MEPQQIPIRRRGIFRPDKNVEELRGGVLEYRFAERRDPRSGCEAAAEGFGGVRPISRSTGSKLRTSLRAFLPGGLATPTLCHSNEKNISGPSQEYAFAASR